jgi:hypothetical protein
MKKTNTTKKTRLHVDTETLRILHNHELRDVNGGNRPISKASNADVCCA